MTGFVHIFSAHLVKCIIAFERLRSHKTLM